MGSSWPYVNSGVCLPYVREQDQLAYQVRVGDFGRLRDLSKAAKNYNAQKFAYEEKKIDEEEGQKENPYQKSRKRSQSTLQNGITLRNPSGALLPLSFKDLEDHRSSYCFIFHAEP